MLYVLMACIGLMCILKYGSILSWPRDVLTSRIEFFEDLFGCSLCLGFWCGVAVGSAMFFLDWNPYYYLLPLVSAACCWFFDSLLMVIQTIEINLDLYRRANLPIPKPKNERD